MKNTAWDLKNWYRQYSYYFVDDVFTKSELEKIISISQNSEECMEGISGIYNDKKQIILTDKRQRDCKIGFFNSNNEEMKWAYEKLSDVIKWVNENFFKFDLSYLECLQFTEYKKNNFYTKHIDMIYDPLSMERKLSFSLLLNDPNLYKGGDLILHLSSNPDIMEKKHGRIFFFPSYTMHEVTKVTKGVRQSLVGWTRGPFFK